MTGRHCLSLFDLSTADIERCLALAKDMKANPQNYSNSLHGRSIALLFEKPSLRTRVSFEVGIHQLGGHAVYLDNSTVGPGQRESVQDIARNLACWTDAIIARVYSHNTLQQLSLAGISVVNALCDMHHPCQTLADLLTLQEQFGDDLSEVEVAYLGDGNNVCKSLMAGAAMLNIPLTVVTPENLAPEKAYQLQLADQFAHHRITFRHDAACLKEADALYTDTWISMGESSDSTKKQVLASFQVNDALLAQTGAHVVMHCLPAHREEEITSRVLDGPHSVVLQQAENRMHVQKALLHLLLNGAL